MKKSLFIILIALSLGACATQEPVAASHSSLLTFEQIAAEITVAYEELEPAEGLDDAVAMSVTNTPK